LSLLLGFTLAMALPRYDTRRQLVIDEANAIGTTALRSEMLPEPQRSAMSVLIVQYIDQRLGFATASERSRHVDEFQNESERLQKQMWSQAVAVAQTNPNPITATFIQSLNDMIDVSEKRLAALENHIPYSVWVMLVLIAMLTSLANGATARKRFRAATILTPLMIAIVMGLIADLDSPRAGFIQTDVRSLVRIEQDLKSQPARGAGLAVPPAALQGNGRHLQPQVRLTVCAALIKLKQEQPQGTMGMV
jgi:hypothetical protein